MEVFRRVGSCVAAAVERLVYPFPVARHVAVAVVAAVAAGPG